MGVKQVGKFNLPNTTEINGIKKSLPMKLANITKNHFVEGFRKGGGQTNKSRSGWKKLADKTSKYKRKDNKPDSILIDSSALMKDIDKRKVTFSTIIVGTSSLTDNYADIHNEGLGKTPQREFIGNSNLLEYNIEKKIITEVNKLFKF